MYLDIVYILVHSKTIEFRKFKTYYIWDGMEGVVFNLDLRLYLILIEPDLARDTLH
jgi:hypothetical protein